MISCDRSHRSYDLCTITGPTVMDPTTSTFFLVNPSPPHTAAEQQKIRPYPRKWENAIMARIKELTLLTLLSTAHPPHCQIRHGAPALVFSAGGHTGNFFHDFNDGFIPLFITSNSLFPDQDIVLVISKARDWWVTKYRQILRTFSKHPIINLDNETSTHCFPAASVGLISHGFMAINPAPALNVTFTNFRAFLAKAYGAQTPPRSRVKLGAPRLVLVGRSGRGVGRRLLNQDEVRAEAERVGFEVVVLKATMPLQEAYWVVRGSEAMVGVHGAGLTHVVFMRPGAVVVQVVPLGAEWASEVCFGRPAREMMGMEYMEYKIRANESSLIEKYGEDEMVVKDPVGFIGNKWSKEIMDVYLKEQDVRLDLVRFRKYLKKAYRKAKLFLQKDDHHMV